MEYSLTVYVVGILLGSVVLILILMEYSLTLCKRVIYVFFSCFFTVGIPFTPESYFHQGDFFANVCEILFHSK